MFRFPAYAARVGIVVLSGISVAGCQGLSKEGPTAQEIKSKAAVTVTGARTKTIFDYVLIDVDGDAVNQFGTLPKGSLFGTFGNAKSKAAQLKLGVGDVVQVTIFEAQTGGLFIPTDAGARPGNYVTFPAQQIDGEGKLTVPYAGPINFAGRSIIDVQNEIADKLSNRAIEPQVMITLANQRSSQVSVVGDVRSASRIDINPAGDRIIDVLARAGGPASPGYETYVTLERGRSKSTMYFDDILSDANENIFVHPDDTIYVYREAESFLAFGATNSGNTGASTKIDFGSSHITLAEGIAKMGGLDDTRADAKKVFIYRVMDRDQLSHAKVDLKRFAANQKSIPVIFQIDFRNPSAYFAAQNFSLANKDIVYVDNSGSYELTKFLSLVTNVTSTVTNSANAVSAVRSGREAVRNFND
ncbi:polysaccharide biosynthesis/export family protein [Rhizobium sp. BE258]|uniref:polysaccharide biosynthesis/export family protein n=1 Tax=Rhizobium sp. BE258 TaxID=2817722 RepID=UPI00285F768D|nr:polysaccharide biosynthesis/export family protein [Rhizobium sp. BE258]MDR7145210.1 polysaccharide export outer membrane protein [Rhizobium sp. BE258]